MAETDKGRGENPYPSNQERVTERFVQFQTMVMEITSGDETTQTEIATEIKNFLQFVREDLEFVQITWEDVPDFQRTQQWLGFLIDTQVRPLQTGLTQLLRFLRDADQLTDAIRGQIREVRTDIRTWIETNKQNLQDAGTAAIQAAELLDQTPPTDQDEEFDRRLTAFDSGEGMTGVGYDAFRIRYRRLVARLDDDQIVGITEIEELIQQLDELDAQFAEVDLYSQEQNNHLTKKRSKASKLGARRRNLALYRRILEAERDVRQADGSGGVEADPASVSPQPPPEEDPSPDAGNGFEPVGQAVAVEEQVTTLLDQIVPELGNPIQDQDPANHNLIDIEQALENNVTNQQTLQTYWIVLTGWRQQLGTAIGNNKRGLQRWVVAYQDQVQRHQVTRPDYAAQIEREVERIEETILGDPETAFNNYQADARTARDVAQRIDHALLRIWQTQIGQGFLEETAQGGPDQITEFQELQAHRDRFDFENWQAPPAGDTTAAEQAFTQLNQEIHTLETLIQAAQNRRDQFHYNPHLETQQRQHLEEYITLAIEELRQRRTVAYEIWQQTPEVAREVFPALEALYQEMDRVDALLTQGVFTEDQQTVVANLNQLRETAVIAIRGFDFPTNPEQPDEFNYQQEFIQPYYDRLENLIPRVEEKHVVDAGNLRERLNVAIVEITTIDNDRMNNDPQVLRRYMIDLQRVREDITLLVGDENTGVRRWINRYINRASGVAGAADARFLEGRADVLQNGVIADAEQMMTRIEAIRLQIWQTLVERGEELPAFRQLQQEIQQQYAVPQGTEAQVFQEYLRRVTELQTRTTAAEVQQDQYAFDQDDDFAQQQRDHLRSAYLEGAYRANAVLRQRQTEAQNYWTGQNVQGEPRVMDIYPELRLLGERIALREQELNPGQGNPPNVTNPMVAYGEMNQALTDAERVIGQELQANRLPQDPDNPGQLHPDYQHHLDQEFFNRVRGAAGNPGLLTQLEAPAYNAWEAAVTAEQVFVDLQNRVAALNANFLIQRADIQQAIQDLDAELTAARNHNLADQNTFPIPEDDRFEQHLQTTYWEPAEEMLRRLRERDESPFWRQLRGAESVIADAEKQDGALMAPGEQATVYPDLQRIDDQLRELRLIVDDVPELEPVYLAVERKGRIVQFKITKSTIIRSFDARELNDDSAEVIDKLQTIIINGLYERIKKIIQDTTDSVLRDTMTTELQRFKKQRDLLLVLWIASKSVKNGILGLTASGSDETVAVALPKSLSVYASHLTNGLVREILEGGLGVCGEMDPQAVELRSPIEYEPNQILELRTCRLFNPETERYEDRDVQISAMGECLRHLDDFFQGRQPQNMSPQRQSDWASERREFYSMTGDTIYRLVQEYEEARLERLYQHDVTHGNINPDTGQPPRRVLVGGKVDPAQTDERYSFIKRNGEPRITKLESWRAWSLAIVHMRFAVQSPASYNKPGEAYYAIMPDYALSEVKSGTGGLYGLWYGAVIGLASTAEITSENPDGVAFVLDTLSQPMSGRGFAEALLRTTETRDLRQTVLRVLRDYPEHRWLANLPVCPIHPVGTIPTGSGGEKGLYQVFTGPLESQLLRGANGRGIRLPRANEDTPNPRGRLMSLADMRDRKSMDSTSPFYNPNGHIMYEALPLTSIGQDVSGDPWIASPQTVEDQISAWINNAKNIRNFFKLLFSSPDDIRGFDLTEMAARLKEAKYAMTTLNPFALMVRNGAGLNTAQKKAMGIFEATARPELIRLRIILTLAFIQGVLLIANGTSMSEVETRLLGYNIYDPDAAANQQGITQEEGANGLKAVVAALRAGFENSAAAQQWVAQLSEQVIRSFEID